MSDKAKSRILSSNITMSSSENSTPYGLQKKTIPWNILICSDLGYKSKKPEAITASILNDFIESKNIIFRGNIKDVSENGEVFIEYPIKSIKNFSSEKIIHKVLYTHELQHLCNTLQEVLEGTIDKQKAIDTIISRRSLTPQFKEALDILRVKNADAPKYKNTLKREKSDEKEKALDNIFSSMDLAPSEQKISTTPNSALDNLVSAITSEFSVTLPKDRINSLISKCKKQINEQVKEILNNNLFKQYKSSWLCIRHLIKILARNKECNLFLYSASFNDISDSFVNAMDYLSNQNTSPDIVLFDYPLTFSTAHMQLIGTVAGTANSNNSMTLTHCGLDEQLLNELQNVDTLKPLFKEQRFIPFYRLRRNDFSRNLVLTVPPFTIESKDIVPSFAGGSWLLLFAIIQKLSRDMSPFEGRLSMNDTGITVEYPLRFASGLTGEHTYEAAQKGITLLSKETFYPYGEYITTLIDPEIAAELYTYFEYNLLTNRVLKIIGFLLRDSVLVQDITNLPNRVKRIIIDQLNKYRLLHSEEEVLVSLSDNRELEIVVDSQKEIRSCPFQLQFSFRI
jgi:predicted component of type VI protein secretion system